VGGAARNNPVFFLNRTRPGAAEKGSDC